MFGTWQKSLDPISGNSAVDSVIASRSSMVDSVNPAGVVTGGPFVYGPYGEQIGVSHADQTSSSADYGWVGQHQKATETLLQNVVQMGARPYHPNLGRFLAVDPVEGGTANDYVYVTDPVNSFDLAGTWCILGHGTSCEKKPERGGSSGALERLVEAIRNSNANVSVCPVFGCGGVTVTLKGRVKVSGGPGLAVSMPGVGVGTSNSELVCGYDSEHRAFIEGSAGPVAVGAEHSRATGTNIPSGEGSPYLSLGPWGSENGEPRVKFSAGGGYVWERSYVAGAGC